MEEKREEQGLPHSWYTPGSLEGTGQQKLLEMGEGKANFNLTLWTAYDSERL